MHDFLASIPSNAEGCAACAPLDDFLVISASGADALTFLHGQLTQDVTGLPADAARLAGYCTAGRLLATLLMWRAAPAPAMRRRSCTRCCARICRKPCSSACPCSCCAKAKLAATALHACGVRAANDAQLAALEAAAGPLPRQTWERAELPSGTWIAAPSAAGERRWWWIARTRSWPAPPPWPAR